MVYHASQSQVIRWSNQNSGRLCNQHVARKRVGGGGGVYSLRRNWITDWWRVWQREPTSKVSVYREIYVYFGDKFFLFVYSVDYLRIHCKKHDLPSYEMMQWLYALNEYITGILKFFWVSGCVLKILCFNFCRETWIINQTER